MIDGRSCYEHPIQALRAGLAAAQARAHGITRFHDPAGWALWVDRDEADWIAGGLRLTGYRVAVVRRYTSAVIILDDVDPKHIHWFLGGTDCTCGATMLDELARNGAR